MPDEVAKLTPTRPARIAGDLGDALEQVCAVLGQTSAEYLDPLIRTQIENDYRANSKAIEAKRLADEAVREARERARKLRDELPELANDLGGEGG